MSIVHSSIGLDLYMALKVHHKKVNTEYEFLFIKIYSSTLSLISYENRLNIHNLNLHFWLLKTDNINVHIMIYNYYLMKSCFNDIICTIDIFWSMHKIIHCHLLKLYLNIVTKNLDQLLIMYNTNIVERNLVNY